VERAAAAVAEETGYEDYRKVLTHDLRRCWANQLLVGEGVSPRIVMALGGWPSYDAIEPYLAAPTDEKPTGRRNVWSCSYSATESADHFSLLSVGTMIDYSIFVESKDPL